MSILLLILAGVVVYYLYITLQEYLKNPTTIKPPTKEPSPSPYPLESNPYATQTPAQKLQNSYEGASITLLAYVLQAGINKQTKAQVSLEQETPLESSTLDSKLTPLQFGLVEEFVRTLCAHATKPEYEQDLRALLAHYASIPELQSEQKAQSTLDFSTLEQPSIAHLAGIFLDNTYGEYKKRLQFVELLLILAWSDRDLNHDEQDIILDIAAFLEIDNADFNTLYESFETLESSPSDEALKVAKTLEQIWSEQSTQDQKSLQEAFFTHIQKLYANARKKGISSAALLQALWQSEQSYYNLGSTLKQASSVTSGTR
ncbi:TerB family tellurite resistance protein [Helicobacter sp.]|uniref:TerB family tellurite resistance protein n=1 Tax=Helicobacter sp. TaxID=218 RepID=UPI0025C3BFE3|nr:TerB family tellurite resistance protein [Helicobacter sp.]MBR2495257.1 TerB family tellurite resistance protein [Helicobacter sp.]